jgi:hypothetical protein
VTPQVRARQSSVMSSDGQHRVTLEKVLNTSPKLRLLPT